MLLPFYGGSVRSETVTVADPGISVQVTAPQRTGPARDLGTAYGR